MKRDKRDDRPLMVFVSRLPAPYREPLFQRVVDDGPIDLHVIYQVRTRAGTAWGRMQSSERIYTYSHECYAEVRKGWWQAAGAFLHVLRRLRDLRPDLVVIHGYSFAASWAAIIYCRLSRTRYALRSDSNGYCNRRTGLPGRLKSCFLHGLVEGAHAVLYIGTANRKYWMHYGATEQQLIEARYAVDETVFRPGDDFARVRRPVRFLYVGRLIPRKNVMTLLQAFAAVLEERDDIRLTVVGGGPLEEAVTACIDNMPAGAVTYRGKCLPDQLPGIYRAHDVLMCPYENEPWGLTINEAMSSGLAVVAATNGTCGAAVDLVIDQQNGIGLADISEERLIEAIVLVAEDLDRLSVWKSRSLQIIEDWKYRSAVKGFGRAAVTARSA